MYPKLLIAIADGLAPLEVIARQRRSRQSQPRETNGNSWPAEDVPRQGMFGRFRQRSCCSTDIGARSIPPKTVGECGE
jgi:hypothetical protein